MNISALPLFRERPASRMIAAEAASTLPLAVMVLPYLLAGDDTAPEWAQLLGLAIIVTLYLTAVHTWRLVLAGGLHPCPPHPHPRPLQLRVRDERRLRVLVLGYPVLLAVLLPIPATWTAFWFWVTVISAVASAVSAVRMIVMLHRR
ncbi:hypothetical protein ACFWYW_00415 [Nonomuraea sp. NPDC059023]|uniref:hypothetical protein n=1 Tax=unclassified Nonomuraea TaxID=2593643 RepID=UPI00368A241F